MGLMAAVAAVVLVLTGAFQASAAQLGPGAGMTSLWPRFSTPRTVLNVNVNGLSSQDLLTATTLQGVYNGEQRPDRLYLQENATDPFWLANGIPQGVQVVQVPRPSDGNVLGGLLQQYRPFITGAIVDDYVPGSTTVNVNVNTVDVASSMAGADHAIVINPTQLSLIQSLGIPVLYTFDQATFDPMTRAQTFQWAVDQWSAGGLLAKVTRGMLVELNPTVPDDVRDYGVASGSFFYYLTSTDPAEDSVIHQILANTPHNTPIMGYVPNENPDVADLSAQGHFLNASDFLTDASVWAAMPSPAFLRQPTAPAPLAAQPNTVYVAFQVSDGDNSQYVQHTMSQTWQDPNLGSVPEGWTVPPGAVNFDPTMLEYFYDHVPSNSELVAGASGIGYVTQQSGSDLTQFAQLSGRIMGQEDLETVNAREALDNLDQYAGVLGRYIPSVSFAWDPVLYQQVGGAVTFGDTSVTPKTGQSQFCTLEQNRVQLAAEQAPGQPIFLEPFINGFNFSPTDVLHIAQQLALAGQAEGVNYVFTTPTELALTMQRYYAGKEAGLPVSNAQSMTGAQVLAEPLVSGSYPTGPVQVTGPNLIGGATDSTSGWSYGNFSSGPPNGASSVAETTYQGAPALHWTDTITNQQSWEAHPVPAQTGNTYTFSAEVAGSGQVFLDAFDSVNRDQQTIPINLTSSYQTLTWTSTIPSNASPGNISIALRESGASPVSAYIRNVSVAASTAPC